MVELREKLAELSDAISRKAARYNQKAPKPSRIQIITLILLSIPAMFFRRYFIAFILMVLVTALSVIVKRFELGRFGLELSTLSAVTMATVFPPKIAAALGFTYIVLQIFSGSTPGIYLTWVIPTYTIAAYIIATMDVSNVSQIGIYTTVISQMFFAFMTFLTSRSRLPKYVQYAVFNLVFNFLMFQSFAEPLVSVMNS
jgi:hypothetical protein